MYIDVDDKEGAEALVKDTYYEKQQLEEESKNDTSANPEIRSIVVIPANPSKEQKNNTSINDP